MPPRRAAWFIAAAVLILRPPTADAQQFPQTREPPLADAPGAIQQASATQPLPPLPPGPRPADLPAVVLRVGQPNAVAAGQEIEYRFHVENLSRTPATGVVVTDALPHCQIKRAEPKYDKQVGDDLLWLIGDLGPGEKREILLTVVPPADAKELKHRPRVQFEYGQDVKTPISRPTLTLRKIAPARAQQSDVLVMALEVTNPTRIDVDDVKLTEPFPDGLEFRTDESAKGATPVAGNPRARTWTVGKLRPGETKRVEYHVIARKAGAIAHTATAEGAGGAKAEATETVTVAEAKFELLATGPKHLYAHQPARYQFTVRNTGAGTLRNLVVTDWLPPDCEVVSQSDGGQRFDHLAQWIVPALAPTESRTLELVAKCEKGGAATHKAAATYRDITTKQEVTTDFDAVATLQWEVTASASAVELKGLVNVTVTVRNTGAAAATNVRPTVTLPASLVLEKAEPTHQLKGDRIAFDAATLAAGQGKTYQLQVRAEAPAVAARVDVELAADVFTSGPMRKGVSVAVGGDAPK